MAVHDQRNAHRSASGEAQTLCVDALEQRAFRTSPLNVAAERDFHRIDAKGVAPDALENAFSGFEGELALQLHFSDQMRFAC